MMKSEIGMLCILFLVSGFLLGNGEWKSIIGGVIVGLIGIREFKNTTEKELK